MKLYFLILALFFSNRLPAQFRYNAALLDTLQQIACTPGTAKYFARLYYKVVETTNCYLARLPQPERQFITGFETVFAQVFFRSYGDDTARRRQQFSWQQYYAGEDLNELQYQFMGMNAHINGDMWMALKNAHGYDTLKKYGATLLRFQKELNVYFDSMYNNCKGYAKVKRLHTCTLGMDRFIGRQMLLHWRKRQLRLANLFYTHPNRCQRKWERLKKKMLRYNRFAKRWLR